MEVFSGNETQTNEKKRRTMEEFLPILANAYRKLSNSHEVIPASSKRAQCAPEDFDSPPNEKKKKRSRLGIDFSAAPVGPEQEEAVDQICQIFPDADSEFVIAQLSTGMRVEQLIDQMVNGNYSKRRERLERQRSMRRRQELMDPAFFDVDEFLLAFPNPEEYFGNLRRVVSQLYVE